MRSFVHRDVAGDDHKALRRIAQKRRVSVVRDAIWKYTVRSVMRRVFRTRSGFSEVGRASTSMIWNRWSESMKKINFVNANSLDLELAQEMLSPYAITPIKRTFSPPDLPDLSATTRSRVLAASRDLGEPCMLIQAAVLFGAKSPSNPRRDRTFLNDLSAKKFCEMHRGKQGVVEYALGYTDDGVTARVFRRDMPGRVSTSTQGASDYAVDQIWIPHGYGRTFAELKSYQNIINKRHHLFLDLGAFLGLEIANDVFEVHVTVAGSDTETLKRFESACEELGVKAIHIELARGTNPTHFITSSFHRGALSRVEGEAHEIEQRLTECGFTVSRVKIESMIRNSLVPGSDEEVARRSESNYFEFHVKIAINDTARVEALKELCDAFDAHFSRNPSNQLEDGVVLHFATLRVYGAGRANACARFDEFLDRLKSNGFVLSNILREYTVYDTNVSLDDGWFRNATAAACDTQCEHMLTGNCPFAEQELPVGKSLR